MGVVAGIRQDKIGEARWAVVFHHLDDAALIEALWPLIVHRMGQMGHQAPAVDFRSGEKAGAWVARHTDGFKKNLKANWGEIPPVLIYRRGERVNAWLARPPHSVGNGPVDPARGVPFYLLLVGRPGPHTIDDEAFIPLSFQYELDIFWGVGRLCLTLDDGSHDLEAYRAYAENLARRERAHRTTEASRRAVLYAATEHEGDRFTAQGAEVFGRGMIAWHRTSRVTGRVGVPAQDLIGPAATRAALLEALSEPEPPGLLFLTAHGLGFRPGHPLQRRHQGAIICQDWTGGPVGREQYLAGEDLPASLNLAGMVAVLLASYSGACPDRDEFVYASERGRPVIAPYPFCTRLAQDLLRRGAAVVGAMTDRLWLYGASSDGVTAQTQPYEDVLGRLMEGRPPGDACDQFDVIRASRAHALREELENIKFQKQVAPSELAMLWMTRNASRAFHLFGDPAARPPW